MAKYKIKHSCGCTETVNICGTNVHDERTRKAEWLTSKPCNACINKAAAEKSKEAGMLELTGSEKQVSWAVTIRNEMIAALEKYCEDAIARGGDKATDEMIANTREITSDAVDNIKAVKRASWFIDNRVYSPATLMQDATALSSTHATR